MLYVIMGGASLLITPPILYLLVFFNVVEQPSPNDPNKWLSKGGAQLEFIRRTLCTSYFWGWILYAIFAIYCIKIM